MLKLVLLTAAIVALALVLLSINIILRGGSFRSQHIGQSKAMREKGIHCVQSMDARERNNHAAGLERCIFRTVIRIGARANYLRAAQSQCQMETHLH